MAICFLAIARKAGEEVCNFSIEAVKLVKRQAIPTCVEENSTVDRSRTKITIC